MSTAAHYVPHYTVADYERWEGDWELWHGVPVARSPSPSFRHQQIAGEVVASLRTALAAAGCVECQVVYELDWRIADDIVVRPDISVICDKVATSYLQTPPRLVVEVLSPATEEKDRTAKHALYEQQGVGHYLIVDPAAEAITHYKHTGQKFEQQPSDAPPPIDLTPNCQIAPNYQQVFSRQA